MASSTIGYLAAPPVGAIKICDGITTIDGTNPVTARLIAQTFDAVRPDLVKCIKEALLKDEILCEKLAEPPEPDLFYTLGAAKEIASNTSELPFSIYMTHPGLPGTWDKALYSYDRATRDFFWGVLDPGLCTCGRRFERDLAQVFTSKQGRFAVKCGHSDCEVVSTFSLKLESKPE